MTDNLSLHDIGFVFDSVADFYEQNHTFPILNRKVPPLFLYLEIIRLLYRKKLLEPRIEHMFNNFDGWVEHGGWDNSLSDTEAGFWYEKFFGWGVKYLQKKSKNLYDLITHFHTGEELTVPLLKEYTQFTLSKSQDANERGSNNTVEANEILK